MKTAFEVLQEIRVEYPKNSESAQAVIAMHRYGNMLLEEAAEKALVLLEREHPSAHSLEVMSYAGDGDRFTVSKESILKIKKLIR